MKTASNDRVCPLEYSQERGAPRRQNFCAAPGHLPLTPQGNLGWLKYFVAVTDKSWFRQLAEQQPNEVNFWRPSGAKFKALDLGEPLLFKLHSPDNYIVGGGHFLRYSQLPVSLAWEAFGPKNGVQNLERFLDRIRKYRREAFKEADPTIGCIILVEPFFLPEGSWIPVPRDWPMNAVQGKSYSTAETTGALLWRHVEERLDGRQGLRVGEEAARYRQNEVRQRLGQGAFRVEVTEVYQRRCAITGERTLPVLQAAHIKPYSMNGPHRVENGLCLRADMHILFDQGYLTVTPNMVVEVSREIKERFENGRDYYAYHGQKLSVLPPSESDQPAREFLEWHNQRMFIT